MPEKGTKIPETHVASGKYIHIRNRFKKSHTKIENACAPFFLHIYIYRRTANTQSSYCRGGINPMNCRIKSIIEVSCISLNLQIEVS